MTDLNLGLEVIAILATLVYMSLLIAENFSSEERSIEEFEFSKRSLLNQHIVAK